MKAGAPLFICLIPRAPASQAVAKPAGSGGGPRDVMRSRSPREVMLPWATLFYDIQKPGTKGTGSILQKMGVEPT